MYEKSLPNPFQRMCCRMLPLQTTAMSCLVFPFIKCEYVAFRQTYSLTAFTLLIDRPFLYFVSCLVVVLGMRVFRPFAEKCSMSA